MNVTPRNHYFRVQDFYQQNQSKIYKVASVAITSLGAWFLSDFSPEFIASLTVIAGGAYLLFADKMLEFLKKSLVDGG